MELPAARRVAYGCTVADVRFISCATASEHVAANLSKLEAHSCIVAVATAICLA